MVVELKNEIGVRVKSARNLRGLTQAELADKINKSFETISNLERGKTAPNFTTLNEIASALDVELKFFFEFESNSSSPHRSRLISELNAATLSVDDGKLALILALAKVVADSK